ncbi:hypothetical protein AAZX31_03G169700 [Glycine max]
MSSTPTLTPTPTEFNKEDMKMQERGSYLLMNRVLWWRSSHFDVDGHDGLEKTTAMKASIRQGNRALKVRHESVSDLGVRTRVLLHSANSKPSLNFFNLVIFIQTVVVLYNDFT